MRRFATTPIMLLGVGIALVAVACAAPEWTRKMGLDVWHLGNERDKLRTATELGHHLDARNHTEARRREMCNHIAIALLERRSTLDESVEAILAVASTSPEWLASAMDAYQANQVIGPVRTKRDVAKRYLLNKLEMMRVTAECRGDLSQAAGISARLVELNEEVQRGAAPRH